MPVLYKPWVSRKDLREHPDYLFLFGDNEIQEGFGGQAKSCRGEPNAIGIPTKKRPSMDKDDFWYDNDYDRVTSLIALALQKPIRHLENGGYVVIPSSGIGTGLARLHQTAPAVFQYLQRRIRLLSGISTS